jgi:uncharacterized circularly permuted ATP-grasp superfamily protein
MASEPEATFDEHLEAGEIRPLYAPLLRSLAEEDLAGLQVGVAAALRRDGVTFDGREFAIDPVPRLISAVEWDFLEAGLVQRTRALNRFLLDAYSERAVVREGILPEDTIIEAEGFEPRLDGRMPEHAWPAAVIGFDLVRDATGEFLVLEDNVRTPSGYAYAVAARAALSEVLPPGLPAPRAVEEVTFELLADAVRRVVPPDLRGADPREAVVVVLTDGPENVAYYEHALAAERLGAILATPDELLSAGERLQVRRGGVLLDVAVVYRRTNEDRVEDEDGHLTDVASKLLPAWLAGRIGLVNAFGNGVADDKLVHSHVEDFIRFYLGEAPLVSSVPTRQLHAGSTPTIEALRELVIKPRHGQGGDGVVIGPHAQAEDLERLARELADDPEGFISQPMINLSRHPTVIDGRLAPRHVDLRPFAFAGEQVRLIPGGLSRFAFDEGALVVNSSQNGGGKDTWVID